MNYFSSDWHLGHVNIMKYDGRPFKTIKEMDETILKNVCSTVKNTDSLYFLGDFAFARTPDILKGYMQTVASTGAKLFFIKGNHDKKDTIRLYELYGTYLGEQKKIKIPDMDARDGIQEIVLNHYRMDVWDKSHHGTWHLHGHSHHTLAERPTARCLDVGINGREYNYTPVSYDWIKKAMSRKTFVPIDHHGKTERV